MASWKVTQFLIIVWGITAYPGYLQAETDIEEILERASSNYLEGRFLDAIEDYQTVIQSGLENSSLYYNLGNAYFKSQQRGHALAAYFRAFELAPRDPDLKFNIAFVLSQNKDAVAWVWSAPAWLRGASLYGRLSAKEIYYMTAFFTGFAGLFLGLWAYGRWAPKASKILAGLFLILTAYSLSLSLLAPKIWPNWGAVSAERAQVLSSPSKQSGLVLFELSEGAPVIVKETLQGWSRIELPDQKEGWLAPGDLAYMRRGQ